MKTRFVVVLSLSLGLLLADAARADSPVLGAVVGGGLGAVVGNQIGGRDGAIVGGAVGAAAGVIVASNDDYRHRDRGYGYYYPAPPPPVRVYAPPPVVYRAAPVYAPAPVYVTGPVYAPAPVYAPPVQVYYRASRPHGRHPHYRRDDYRHWR